MTQQRSETQRAATCAFDAWVGAEKVSSCGHHFMKTGAGAPRKFCLVRSDRAARPQLPRMERHRLGVALIDPRSDGPRIFEFEPIWKRAGMEPHDVVPEEGDGREADISGASLRAIAKIETSANTNDTETTYERDPNLLLINDHLCERQ
jgi:hypothetical protein